jgi:hypothetical protein
MNAVFEGLDWPIASHFYFVGIPLSLPLTIQGLGRVMRKRDHGDKWTDYPKFWKTESKLVMITGNVHDIKARHGSSVLRVVSYLGSLQPLDILNVVKEKFNNKLGAAAGEKAAVPINYPVNEDALPEACEAVTQIQAWFYGMVHAAQNLTKPNIISLFEYYQSLPEPPWECTVQDIKVALTLNDKKSFANRFGNKLEEKLSQPLGNKEDKEIIMDAFRETVDEFIDETEVPCDASTGFGKIQALQVDSQIIEDFAERVAGIDTKISFSEAVK